MMRKAFTLIEVNLAILVMAGSILSVVVLYTLGYRETRQSREDIVSTAYSESVLAPLVAKLSDKELSWEVFNKIRTKPEDGWGGFFKDDTDFEVRENTEAKKHLEDVLKISLPNLTADGFYSGLVVFHEEGSGLVKIGYRTSRRLKDLLSAPLYYTEVRFQGGFGEEK